MATLALLAVLLVLPPIPGAEAPLEPYNRLYDSGVEAYYQGKYRQQLEVWRPACTMARRHSWRDDACIRAIDLGSIEPAFVLVDKQSLCIMKPLLSFICDE
ncbi:hypothetical protein NDU88_006966 [Pleurodeles waltl]|uniref:Uncharacterized protein n=1 Tax=Pleurodeles waltl TaxID=8319 RepID=A0AAV7U032_PLEWA|nr:hypothetical protein NDU88_006966 [Pleurodeles waltl]